jgi:hypothetical protein
MSATAIFLAFLCATDLHVIAGTEGCSIGSACQRSPAQLRRHQRAAGGAPIAGAGWLLGMVVAVITERPLF